METLERGNCSSLLGHSRNHGDGARRIGEFGSDGPLPARRDGFVRLASCRIHGRYGERPPPETETETESENSENKHKNISE